MRYSLLILFVAGLCINVKAGIVSMGGTQDRNPIPSSMCGKIVPPSPAVDGGAKAVRQGNAADNGAQNSQKSADPVSSLDFTFFEDLTDVSIPVKHGLNLQIRRQYSSKKGASTANAAGDVPLGYNENKTESNWHLHLVDSRIQKGSWTKRELKDSNNNTFDLSTLASQNYAGISQWSGNTTNCDGGHCSSLVDKPGGLPLYARHYNLQGLGLSVREEQQEYEWIDASGNVQTYEYAGTVSGDSFDNKLMPAGDNHAYNAILYRLKSNNGAQATFDNKLYIIYSSRKAFKLKKDYDDLGVDYTSYEDKFQTQINDGTVTWGECAECTFNKDDFNDAALVAKSSDSTFYFAPAKEDIDDAVFMDIDSTLENAIESDNTEPDFDAMAANGDIKYFVVRTGGYEQFIYDKDGNLISYDKNYLNNVATTDANYVDDHIDVVWETKSTHKRPTKIKAPETDGRELRLNYDSSNKVINSVDLYSKGNFAGTVVSYQYHNTAGQNSIGLLKRAIWNSGANEHGVQYDYGQFNPPTGTSSEVTQNENVKNKLCLISEYAKDSSGETVTGLMGVVYTYGGRHYAGNIIFGQVIPNTNIRFKSGAEPENIYYNEVESEWFRDPNSTNWRKACSYDLRLYTQRAIAYEAGRDSNGLNPYPNCAPSAPDPNNPDGSKPQSILVKNNNGDLMRVEYATGSPQHITRTVFTTDEPNRDGEKLVNNNGQVIDAPNSQCTPGARNAMIYTDYQAEKPSNHLASGIDIFAFLPDGGIDNSYTHWQPCGFLWQNQSTWPNDWHAFQYYDCYEPLIRYFYPSANANAGIAKGLEKVRLYHRAASGMLDTPTLLQRYVDDPQNYFETAYTYLGAEACDCNSIKSVVYPGGIKLVYTYDMELGEPDHHRVRKIETYKNRNLGGTADYQLLSTLEIQYYSGNVKNNDLVLKTIYTPRNWGNNKNEPIITKEYTYYGDTALEIAGTIKSIKTDTAKNGNGTDFAYESQTIDYQQNVFGQPTLVTYNKSNGSGQIARGQVTLEYSGTSSPIDTYMPPRLVKWTGLDGHSTQYGYYPKNLLASVTVAVGEPKAKTSSYLYDLQSNVKQVTAPDGGQTKYVYDIYGRLMEMAGPNETLGTAQSTKYTYDEFGRVRTETLPSGIKKTFSYMGHPGAAGVSNPYATSQALPTGGVGMDNLFSVNYYKDAEHQKTIYFRYDKLGRMLGQGTTNAATDVEYIYDNPGSPYDELLLHEVRFSGNLRNSDGDNTALWGTGKFTYDYNEYGQMIRETYPNGRRIDYGYDPQMRLASFKDPFGFINQLDFDTKGRLSTYKHSTLGTTRLIYNDGVIAPTHDNDELYQIISGEEVNHAGQTSNPGFHKVFTYEDEPSRRLKQFTIKGPNDTPSIWQESWTYNELGIRDALSILDNQSRANTINLTYDDNLRLTAEKLTRGGSEIAWEMSYEYADPAGKAGNRSKTTHHSTLPGWPGDFVFTDTFANENRSASPNMSYDWMGNVSRRVPLRTAWFGAEAYNYSWNAYNQLWKSDRDGAGKEVLYEYGPSGYLLRQQVVAGANRERTEVIYSIDGTRVAKEVAKVQNADLPVLRPFSETSNDPYSEGWGIQQGADATRRVAYVVDDERGTVADCYDAYFPYPRSANFLLGDYAEQNINPNGTAFAQDGYVVAGLWLKNQDQPSGLPYLPVKIMLFVKTTNNQYRNLTFVTGSGTNYAVGSCAVIYLGNKAENKWDYFDLDADFWLNKVRGEHVSRITGLGFQGAIFRVDDVTLSPGAMERSYQAFVGGGTGEYLGMQVGGYGGFKKYYFHNDERGSLLALSDDTGATLNGYTYDGFGNYLTSDNNDYPIEYGINGKFCDIGLRRSKFDETVADYDTRTGCGLYYFGARWYDFERGRWVSHEPLGYAGGSNLYQFNFNNPYAFVDPDGLAPNEFTWYNFKDYGRYKIAKRFSDWITGKLSGLAGHNDATYAAMGQCPQSSLDDVNHDITELGAEFLTDVALLPLSGLGKAAEEGNDALRLGKAAKAGGEAEGIARFAKPLAEIKVSDVLKTRKGSIKNAPLPPGSPNWDQISKMTMKEIETGAKAGEKGYKTILKLLKDGRFSK